jgi:predicted nucleotidyltransferase
MPVMYDKFVELMKALGEYKVEYILIGGLAINLHGFTRNTEDIDLFVKPVADNITNLQKALYKVFKDNEIYQITIDEITKYSVVRYGTDFLFYIDIISKIGEKFSYSDLKYEEIIVEGIVLKVADIETLYKLKEKTFREIDQLDIKFLKSKMNR